MSIANNLAKIRLEKGMSQAELAQISGVSQQLISQIERGENATTKKMYSLAKALSVHLKEIDDSFDLSLVIPIKEKTEEIIEINNLLFMMGEEDLELIRGISRMLISRKSQPKKEAERNL